MIVDSKNILHVCAWCRGIEYENQVVCTPTEKEYELIKEESDSGKYMISHGMCNTCLEGLVRDK